MRFGIEAGEHTMTLAKDLSFTGVPIDGHALVAKNGVETVMTPLRDAGLDACQIGMFDFNPLAETHSKKVETTLRQVILLASETGSRSIVIGPGNYNHEGAGFASHDRRNFTDHALETMADTLRPLCQLAEKNHVRLCIEAYLKGAVHSARRFRELADLVASPALACNVDPTSLYTFSDVVDPRGRVDRTCKQLAGRYGVVHLKEVAISDGFHVHMGMVPLGEGPTDWRRMLEQLREYAKPDDWLVIEHVGSVEEGLKSHDLIRGLAADVGLELT